MRPMLALPSGDQQTMVLAGMQASLLISLQDHAGVRATGSRHVCSPAPMLLWLWPVTALLCMQCAAHVTLSGRSARP